MKVVKCNNPLGPNIMRRHANIAWQMCSNNIVSRCPTVNIWLIVSCESEHPHISLISWERLFKQSKLSTVGHNWWLRLLPWILIRNVLFVRPLAHKFQRFLWGLSPTTGGQRHRTLSEIVIYKTRFRQNLCLSLKRLFGNLLSPSVSLMQKNLWWKRQKDWFWPQSKPILMRNFFSNWVSVMFSDLLVDSIRTIRRFHPCVSSQPQLIWDP